MPLSSDVSVVICTRNRPAHLRNALAAIAAATPAATQVLVVDSGSDSPETRAVADAAGVDYVRSTKGLSIARNAGIVASDRPIVMFTDDDCLPAPGWIDAVLDGFSDPGVGAVTGRMVSDGRAVDTEDSRRRVYRSARDGIDAGHGAVMAFRRELLLRLGGFDDVMGAGQRYAGAEDLDIFVRVLRAGATIRHDPRCVITHANTRLGDEYVSLHRGYGLGLGALLGKWSRIDPALGMAMAWRLLGRTVVRLARAELSGSPSAHDRAMLAGIARGARETRSLPLVGERFVPPWAPSRVPALTVRPEETMAPPVNTAPAAAPVSVDLLRTLDESHIANSLQFEAMHVGAVVVLEGDPLTGPDGLLDREKILGAVARGLRRVPELTMRLVDVPLGVTAPAWVPDEDFDVRRHVFFEDEPAELAGHRLRRLMSGGRGTFPRDRPLWDFTLTRLTTGDVALGARLHHASGDAKWAFETLTEITDGAMQPSDEVAEVVVTRAPRTRLIIPLVALRSWFRAQPTVAAAWAEYWRKPFLKRVRRMGGRNLRPVKEFMIRRRNLRAVFLPPTNTAFFSVDASAAVRRAAKLRGSVNDLLVAGVTAAVDDDERGIDVLVPVARRTKADRAVRNQVSIVRVHAAPAVDLAGRVGAARAQVAAFVTGKDVVAQPEGRLIGYATTLPWSATTRWFCGAEVRECIVLPASNPRDEMSAFAAVYGDRITVTVETRAELDTDGAASRLHATLAGDEAMTGEAA